MDARARSEILDSNNQIMGRLILAKESGGVTTLKIRLRHISVIPVVFFCILGAASWVVFALQITGIVESIHSSWVPSLAGGLVGGSWVACSPVMNAQLRLSKEKTLAEWFESLSTS